MGLEKSKVDRKTNICMMGMTYACQLLFGFNAGKSPFSEISIS